MSVKINCFFFLRTATELVKSNQDLLHVIKKILAHVHKCEKLCIGRQLWQELMRKGVKGELQQLDWDKRGRGSSSARV